MKWLFIPWVCGESPVLGLLDAVWNWLRKPTTPAPPEKVRDLSVCSVKTCRSRRVYPDFATKKVFGKRTQIWVTCPECGLHTQFRATKAEMHHLVEEYVIAQAMISAAEGVEITDERLYDWLGPDSGLPHNPGSPRAR